MQVPSMVNVLTFVSNLKATLTHAEMHGVHVDVPREWLILCYFRHICVLILEDGHLDLNFLASPLSDRFDKAGKSGMTIDRLVNTKS